MTTEEILYDGGKTVSSTNVAGKTEQLHVKKNKIISFFNTIHKNKVKMD